MSSEPETPPKTPFVRVPAVAGVVFSGAPSAVVIGNFDGVHRGHVALLEDARVLAARDGLALTVLTFDPHPSAVVGREPPPRLTTLDRRAVLLRDVGVARVVVRTFDESFARSTPEAFARSLLAETLRARRVIVGENFRFGHKRAGDFAELRRLGESLGFEASVARIASDATGPFSSTRARSALTVGDLAEATHVLGRSHGISGVVVHGDARGRTLGFPTANLGHVPELVPPNGVYAATVSTLEAGVPARLAGGVMNVGVRPTIGGNAERRIEVHLLDFEGDLYGRNLFVTLEGRVRDERKFDGLDALKAGIAADVVQARGILAAVPENVP
ncbi:MAG: bifunctional riboflavin kinase/FAD synthetase [Polyangiaceae bacterium]